MAKKKQKKHKRQQDSVAEYLAAHPKIALEALRQDPMLAVASIRTMFEVDAAARGPQRESSPYPVLGPFGGMGNTQPLQQTLPKPTPANIRRFSELPPARRAIATIRDTIISMPWTIEKRKPIGNMAHRTHQEPNTEEQRRIESVSTMLIAPNNDMSWSVFASMLLEDLLTFGGGPFEAQRNHSDERPYFLWPIDAQSIRINAGWREGSSTFRYSQGRGYYFGSLGSPDLVKFRDDEVCYMKLNPRDSTPFGLGYCEVAFEVLNAFLGAFEYAGRRASNNTPNFGIFLGKNTTIEQARQWRHYWENEIEGYGKTPILGGGEQPSVFTMTGTGEDSLYLRWQELLIRIIAMSFGISPLRLGLERDINRSTATASQDNDWMTVAPIANVLRDYLTYWLLWKQLGWRDLEFVWQTRTTDELKQAEILAEQYNMNAITVDEIRLVYERPPLDDGQGDLTKTPYELSIKAALEPQMMPGEGGVARRQGGITGTPFDQEADARMLAPAEREFMKALKTMKREKRYGLQEVAT